MGRLLYFCLGACTLCASLGSPPGVQTSSRRMSRSALRLTCFFSLSAFPKHQPPGGHKAALSLNSYSLSDLARQPRCEVWERGKKGPSMDSFLPEVFSTLTFQTQKGFLHKVHLREISICPISPFPHQLQPFLVSAKGEKAW